MPLKIAFTGAGSLGFTRGLVRDLLTVPELRQATLALHDISAENLDLVRQLVERDIRENGLDVPILATTDRREAFADANYVLCTVRVGGLEAFQHDVDIPLRYGIDQCVGDTLGPGGILYAQRGIPVLLGICEDIREVAAPGCLLLNYANPMAMLTWACLEYGGVPTVGLCHGVQGSHALIARVLGGNKPHESARELPENPVEIIAAGINHQTWFVSVKLDGREVVDELYEKMAADDYVQRCEKVRLDVMRRFGYWSTESNGHLSEYLPWYRKRPGELLDWIDLSNWIHGETGGYLRICQESRDWVTSDFPQMLEAPAFSFEPENRGNEHGSYIIEALETGRPYRGHMNVRNGGTITNLPADSIIEVPVWADRHGLNVPQVGDLSLGCAAICNQSISVQRMSMEAAVSGDAELLKQAVALDPLTSAVSNTAEVWQMVDDMLLAQRQWLPQYSDAISTTETLRAAADYAPIETSEAESAARLHRRTVGEMQEEAEANRTRAAASEKGGL